MIGRPKQKVVRSEPYRRLVAALPCISCGIEGFTQAAHPNTGKGGGIKTDDRDCFPLCSAGSINNCHQQFDQGAMFTKEGRRRIEPIWSAATRIRLIDDSKNDPSMRAILFDALEGDQ